MKVYEILKSQREQKRLSLQSAHENTRISVSYLEALETGAWESFPAEVYLLGFLRKYSAYLGLNPEEIVNLYKQEIESKRTEKLEEHRKEAGLKKQHETVHTAKFVLLIALLACIGGWWLYTVTAQRSSEPQSTVVAEVPARREGKLHPQRFVQHETLVLNAQALSSVWMRVRADQSLAFEGFLSSGAERSWNAKKEFAIRIGNVHSVRMFLNDQPIDPRPGSKGTVQELVLTQQSLTGAARPPESENTKPEPAVAADSADEPRQ